MKRKSLVIILLTLVIGFVLGFVVSNYVRYRKMKEYRSYITVAGFRTHALELIQPTEDQKKKIIPVIDKFSKANQDLRKQYRSDFLELMKQYHTELDSLLTPEQQERIKQYRSSRQGSGHKKRRSGPTGHKREGEGRAPSFPIP